ncbi:unnamed protein product, partial [marine sediment metagenome]
ERYSLFSALMMRLKMPKFWKKFKLKSGGYKAEDSRCYYQSREDY